jgi:Cu/Ag efflux protein CusF
MPALVPLPFHHSRLGRGHQGRLDSVSDARKESTNGNTSLPSFGDEPGADCPDRLHEFRTHRRGRGAALPLGVDLGGSGPVAAHAPLAENSKHGGEMQVAHEGHNDAHGTGTVNSVDPTQHKVNLSHEPIPEIGWPAMTMEFRVAPSVDLKAIKPGVRANFTIEQEPGGMYEIKAITPAGGGR